MTMCGTVCLYLIAMSCAGCCAWKVVSESDVCCNLLGSIDTQSQSQLLPMNEWIPERVYPC